MSVHMAYLAQCADELWQLIQNSGRSLQQAPVADVIQPLQFRMPPSLRWLPDTVLFEISFCVSHNKMTSAPLEVRPWSAAELARQ